MSGAAGEPSPAQFTRLVLVALGKLDPVSGEELQAATNFSISLRQADGGWQTCLARLLGGAADGGGAALPPAVQFYALSVVYCAMPRYASFAEEQKNAIRRGALTFLRDAVGAADAPPPEAAVKNTLAALLVQLVKHDYPERWRTFFADLLSVAGAGLHTMDVFVRVMRLIEDEVVDVDVTPENRAEIAHNTLIKDVMREESMDRLVDALQSVVTASARPGAGALVPVGAQALEVLGDLVDWVQIELVATAPFMELLYKLLGVPAYQEAAAICLHGVLTKRMPPEKKLALVRELRALEVLGGAAAASMPYPAAESLAAAVAEVGVGLIAGAGELEAELCALEAGAGAGGPARAAAVREALVACRGEVERWLDAALAYVRHSDYRVAWAASKLLADYVATVQAAARPAGAAERVLAAHQHRLLAVLDAVVVAYRFPAWYHHESPEDEEGRFVQHYRKDLMVVYGRLSSVAHGLVVQVLRQRVDFVLGRLHTTEYADVEATLQLLHNLSGWRPARSVGKEPYRSLLLAVATSEGLSLHPHKAVKMAWLDVVYRYCGVLESSREAVAPVLFSFMDQRGMRSPHAQVRSRSCYLFLRILTRLSKDTRRALLPVLDRVLRDLMSVVQPVLGRAQGAHLDTGTAPEKALVSFRDCEYLAEAIGLLIASPLAGERTPGFVAGIMGSLREVLEAGLARRQAWLRADPALAGKRFSQVVKALSCVTKSLTADASKFVPVTRQCLETVLQAFAVLPQDENLRQSVIFFLHRMNKCLGRELAPYIPAVLPLLVSHSTEANVVPLIDLLGDMLITLKSLVGPALDDQLAPLLQVIFTGIHGYTQRIEDPATRGVAAAHSEQEQRLRELRNRYFTLVRLILDRDLSFVIFSDKNGAHAGMIVDSLLGGCVDPPDAKVNKTNFGTLRLLVALCAEGRAPPTLAELLCRGLTSQIFRYPLQAHVDLDDAQCNTVLIEIVQAFVALPRLGEQYGAYLCSFLVQQVGMADADSRAFTHALHAAAASAAAADAPAAPAAARKEAAAAGDQFNALFRQLVAQLKARGGSGASSPGAGPL